MHEFRLRAAVRSIGRFVLVALQLVGNAVVCGIRPLGRAGGTLKIFDLHAACVELNVGGKEGKHDFHLRRAGAEVQKQFPVRKLLRQLHHGIRDWRADRVHIRRVFDLRADGTKLGRIAAPVFLQVRQHCVQPCAAVVERRRLAGEQHTDEIWAVMADDMQHGTVVVAAHRV